MNDQFQILSDFKGFGNPNGKIWFVGLEEATNFETDFDQILKGYSIEYIPAEKGSIQKDAKKYGNSYTKVYDVMAKIMTGLFPKTDWRTYRNNLLLTKEGNEFQMNLYPLGKKSLNAWPEFYQRQFGFKTKQEYLTKVQADRFPGLYNYWKKNAPDFTICFGIGNIDDFKKAFKLNTEFELSESNLYLFPTDKVLITPFFDNRNMGQDRIDKTVTTIQNLFTKNSNNEKT
ncbi:MAG: hypothetical protein KDC86_13880 [Saprospiraceae bacterium]|nr:hypothetical protein [Saprospiraceae bacterium]